MIIIIKYEIITVGLMFAFCNKFVRTGDKT